MNKLKPLFIFFALIILLLIISFSVFIYMSTASSAKYQESLKSQELINKEMKEHIGYRHNQPYIKQSDQSDNEMPQLYMITENEKIKKMSDFQQPIIKGIYKKLDKNVTYHHYYMPYDDQHFYITSQTINPKHQGQIIKIYTIIDSTEMYHSLKSLRTVLIGMTVLYVFIILFVSYWLSKRAIQPLEETNIRQKQFIQDASHELKTPISVLKAGLGVLNTYEKTHLSEIGKEVIDDLNDELTKMNELVMDLLSLSKIEGTLPKSTVKLNDVFENMSKRFNPQLKYPLVIDGANLSIQSNQQALEQAISILIENAIKYNHQDDLQIKLIATRKKDTMITVKDNGIGMTEQDISHMFERFYRGQGTNNIEGSGIGLSIFKALMDSLDANVDVKNNNGLEFQIKL